jgi:hypothetical protein
MLRQPFHLVVPPVPHPGLQCLDDACVQHSLPLVQ